MYASKDDLVTRFGAEVIAGLVTRDDDDEASSEARLDGALTDASNEIDSYLRGRYTLPIATTSTTLKRCAIDLAFYNLHENQVTELVEKRHDDWIKWLVGVSKGTINLDVAIEPPPDGGAVPVIDGGAVEFKHTRPAVFGEQY